MREVKLFWDRGLRFVAHVPSGHSMVTDGESEHGGFDSAPRPMELLLVSLGGCTAMDVASILRKMRQEPEDFSVSVQGERAQEHPKVYTELKIIYEFWGDGLEPAKLAKAIVLSQDRYCSVSAHMRASAKLTWEMVLHTSQGTRRYPEAEARALMVG